MDLGVEYFFYYLCTFEQATLDLSAVVSHLKMETISFYRHLCEDYMK